jgi:hypothetical protein
MMKAKVIPVEWEWDCPNCQTSNFIPNDSLPDKIQCYHCDKIFEPEPEIMIHKVLTKTTRGVVTIIAKQKGILTNG